MAFQQYSKWENYGKCGFQFQTTACFGYLIFKPTQMKLLWKSIKMPLGGISTWSKYRKYRKWMKMKRSPPIFKFLLVSFRLLSLDSNCGWWSVFTWVTLVLHFLEKSLGSPYLQRLNHLDTSVYSKIIKTTKIIPRSNEDRPNTQQNPSTTE